VRNTLEQGLTLPGYLLLKAGIRYTYQHFNAAINIDDITHKTYWIAAHNMVNKWAGAPRNLMISTGYTLNACALY
jgi:iron complex outermembrane recepter protein